MKNLFFLPFPIATLKCLAFITLESTVVGYRAFFWRDLLSCFNNEYENLLLRHQKPKQKSHERGILFLCLLMRHRILLFVRDITPRFVLFLKQLINFNFWYFDRFNILFCFVWNKVSTRSFGFRLLLIGQRLVGTLNSSCDGRETIWMITIAEHRRIRRNLFKSCVNEKKAGWKYLLDLSFLFCNIFKSLIFSP